MKTKFWLILAICLLTLNCAEAKNKTYSSEQHNLITTRHYYTQLISGKILPIAELTMFTNMLPKGGDLHHHYSGAIYSETYLDWVAAQHYCIYRVTDPVLKIEKFRIETKPQELSEAAHALCLNADAVHQDNSFYRELLKRWSDKDYGNHFHEQLPPDQQFFDSFTYFSGAATYDYNKGLQSLKARAKAENVEYLETMLKSGPSINKPELDILNTLSSEQQTEETLTKAYNFLVHDTDTNTKIDAYVQSLTQAAAGIDDADFKLRFQTYASRNNPPAKVFSSLYTSFAAATRSSLIVGVNIVGPENGYVAMRDYNLHMKMFAFLKRHFPHVKLSLHAGELALGMVPPEGLRSHIREAVLIAGANRIGHGIDIPYETNAPELLNIMKQRKVAIEINLTSNEFILGIKNEAHPLLLYAKYGIPFVISTDDAGVSRNNLSDEYLLYLRRYKPSYDQLKQTVYNSIRYSFLPENEKQKEITKLDKHFAVFEARMAKLVDLQHSF